MVAMVVGGGEWWMERTRQDETEEIWRDLAGKIGRESDTEIWRGILRLGNLANKTGQRVANIIGQHARKKNALRKLAL